MTSFDLIEMRKKHLSTEELWMLLAGATPPRAVRKVTQCVRPVVYTSQAQRRRARPSPVLSPNFAD